MREKKQINRQIDEYIQIDIYRQIDRQIKTEGWIERRLMLKLHLNLKRKKRDFEGEETEKN